MKLLRLLPILAAAAIPMSGTPASAGPCVTVDRAPYYFYAVACVGEQGCFVYQDSGSIFHAQVPVCVSR